MIWTDLGECNESSTETDLLRSLLWLSPALSLVPSRAPARVPSLSLSISTLWFAPLLSRSSLSLCACAPVSPAPSANHRADRLWRAAWHQPDWAVSRHLTCSFSSFSRISMNPIWSFPPKWSARRRSVVVETEVSGANLTHSQLLLLEAGGRHGVYGRCPKQTIINCKTKHI